MKQETLFKLLFIDIILTFDVFLIWFSISSGSVLPILFAIFGTILHWPKFMVPIQVKSMTIKQKLWLILSVDTVIVGLVYAIITDNKHLILFYITASLLTLIVRRFHFFTIENSKGAIPV